MTLARSWKRAARQWRDSSRRWRQTCEELAGEIGALTLEHERLIARHAETTGTLDWVMRQHQEMLDAVSAIIERAKKEPPPRTRR